MSKWPTCDHSWLTLKRRPDGRRYCVVCARLDAMRAWLALVDVLDVVSTSLALGNRLAELEEKLREATGVLCPDCGARVDPEADTRPYCERCANE